jgi:hypothetical protein
MNGFAPKNYKILRILNQHGAIAKLSYLHASIKNYAGIFILKMQFPMFYRAG